MLAPLSIGRLKFNHVDEARKNNNSSLSPAMLQIFSWTWGYEGWPYSLDWNLQKWLRRLQASIYLGARHTSSIYVVNASFVSHERFFSFIMKSSNQ